MIVTREHTRATRVVAGPIAPLPLLKPGRRCKCGNPLNRYNPGPCEVCKQKQAKEAAAAAGRPRAVILSLLESAERTIPELAAVIDLPVYDVRYLVLALEKEGCVERLDDFVVQDGRKRRSYRLVVSE